MKLFKEIMNTGTMDVTVLTTEDGAAATEPFKLLRRGSYCKHILKVKVGLYQSVTQLIVYLGTCVLKKTVSLPF